MRIVALIQARMDSKRLHGKVLMDLNGMPTIKHIWRRLLKCKELDEVVISWGCTCAKDETVGCMPCIERVTKAFGFMPRVWTGSELNIVSRHLGAAMATRADAVLRITGDCPLVDPTLADEMVRRYRELWPSCDVLTNWYPKAVWPDGLDMDVQSVEVLQRILSIKDFPKEEYLGDMVKCGLFKWNVMPYPSEDLSSFRMTLDTSADHTALSRILKTIGNDSWNWLDVPLDMLQRQKRPDYLSGALEVKSEQL